jgi:DNA-binding CsgD family transcriptional regulator
VLLVDDVQWVDDPSLAWLGYLARRAGDLPLALILGLRAGDPGGERSELGGLVGAAGVQRIGLAPLSARAVGEIVRGQLDAEAGEAFCAACGELTGGNPLFLRELLAAAREDGLCAREGSVSALRTIAPAAVGTSVLARLGRLGEEAVALARAVAVLGAGAEVLHAAALAEMDPVVAELIADRLVAVQILAAVRPLEFSHPLIGAAVYADIPLGARRVAHRRAAELIDRQGESVAQVAAHLLACGPTGDRWVLEVLRHAARQAVASGAPGSASSYLERALAETQLPSVRVELLLELAEAQLHAGLPGVTEHMRQALELSTDPYRRAEIRLALGRGRFFAGDWPGAREAFRDGVAAVPAGHDELLLELHTWHAVLGGEGVPAVIEERLTALVDDDAPGRTRVERVALAQLAHEAGRSGARPHDQVAGLARRALADGALLRDGAAYIAQHGGACYALLYADQTDTALAELDRAVELSQRRGSPVAFAWFSRVRGTARYFRGELLEALADLESASDAASEGYGQGLPSARGLLAVCLIERDDPTGAASALVLPGDQQRWRSQAFFVTYLGARGRVEARHGKLREARDTLLECGRLAKAMNLANPAANLPWRSDAALLAARLGDTAHAKELVAEELTLARAFGAPRAVGVALRAAGLIDGGKHGLEQLAQAVAVLDRSESKLELARALTDYGAALRRCGHRVQARTELERALDLAHHLGARLITNQARAQLTAAGAKPRRDAITGRDALTPAELRVARLAAEGLTNREIAQALFITTRTAKVHLGRVYRKLEITRRTQLAGALTGLRDDGREHPSASATAIS